MPLDLNPVFQIDPDSDPGVRIQIRVSSGALPKCCYLIPCSCLENRPATVREMPINLLNSTFRNVREMEQ